MSFAEDRLRVVRKRVSNLYRNRCPSCKAPVVITLNKEGYPTWNCKQCHCKGALIRLEGEWLYSSPSEENTLQLDLEAMKASYSDKRLKEQARNINRMATRILRRYQGVSHDNKEKG